ncbi:DUF4167 domain-containing protein [Pelagibacterales bacterium SAG-MED43]|nr:DUF4167 domain-containing protein [Pelagibacterales bacterium SAG-MED43]
MVTFRNNNNRRSNFRRNDRNFKSNGDRPKYVSNFSNSETFQRKVPGRNNHNASKLIEKYNNLAREALSTGDKILSENYFQHADHFMRILSEQENLKKSRYSPNTEDSKNLKDVNKVEDEVKKEESQNKAVNKEEIQSKISVSK